VIRALAILGQRPDQEPPFSGLAFFPASQDWTVRSYWRCIDVSGAAVFRPSSRPSYRLKRVRKAPYASPAKSKSEPCTMCISSARRFRLRNYPDMRRDNCSGQDHAVGRSYAYHDRHSTPFGVINGVELVATAVETEIDHKDEHTEREWVHLTKKWGLKILLSLLVVLIHVRLRPVAAMIGT